MAEAGGSPGATPETNKVYFCYTCNREINSVGPDFSCTTCGSGFIEELPERSANQPTSPFSFSSQPLGGNPGGFGISITQGGMNPIFRSGVQSGTGQQQHPMGLDLFDILTNALSGARRNDGNNQGGPAEAPTIPPTPGSGATTSTTSTDGGQRRPRGHISFVIDSRPRPGNAEGNTATVTVGLSPQGQGQGGGNGAVPGPGAPNENALENMLYSFLTDLVSGLSGGPGGAAANVNITGVPVLGNLGDYVWGRDGLDAIVTQLMNQMEGTGPPPMAAEKVNEIPDVSVTQEHVDRKLQCSVCWDDFILDEKVKQLDCEHLFHPDCIIPWLKLHGTCPICRRDFTEGEQQTQGAATSDSQTPSSIFSSTPMNPNSNPTSNSSTTNSTSQNTGPGSPFSFLASLANSFTGGNGNASQNNQFFVVGGNSSDASSTSTPANTRSGNTGTSDNNEGGNSNSRGTSGGGHLDLDNMEFDFD